MLYGVIDVGSNSVRLLLSDGKTTLDKFSKTTRLAEGMSLDNLLKTVAIERTVAAVSFFYEKATKVGADNICCFATAAVRRADNGDEFVKKVKDACGLKVDVISGEMEAQIGYMGALNGADGGIVDVGGASTEITVVENGIQLYTKSLDIGAVVVTDKCGQDRGAVQEYVNKKVQEYGTVPCTDFYAIGGTATSIVSIALELEPYDPKKVHGYKLDKGTLKNVCERLFSLSVEQRQNLKGLQKDRAKVIASGAEILLTIMEKLKVDYFIVSENDNLEGYLKLKSVNV